MLPRHLTKSLIKYCLMYCWAKMYVLELLIYCTRCIVTSYAMLNEGMRNELVLAFQMVVTRWGNLTVID